MNFALAFTYYWNKRVFLLGGCGWVFTCLIISSCCYFKIYLGLGYRHVKLQPLSQGISPSRRREVLGSSPAQIQGTNPRVLSVLNVKWYKITVSIAIWVHSILVVCYLPFTVATAVTASRGEPLFGTRYVYVLRFTRHLVCLFYWANLPRGKEHEQDSRSYARCSTLPYPDQKDQTTTPGTTCPTLYDKCAGSFTSHRIMNIEGL